MYETLRNEWRRFRIVLYHSEVFDLLLAKEKILLNVVNIGIQI